MGYAQAWKDAKKAFEQATGRKKPGTKVLGVFNKGNGIEAAAKSLDKAIDKGDPDAIGKAAGELASVSADYVALLFKATKEDANKAIEGDITELRKTFSTWGEQAEDSVKQAMTAEVKAALDDWDASYQKQTSALKRLVAGGRSSVGAARQAISEVIEAGATLDRAGLKEASAAAKGALAAIEDACTKLEAIGKAVEKSLAIIRQKANLAAIGKGTPVGKQLMNASNLVDTVFGASAALREDHKVVGAESAEAAKDAARGQATIEQRKKGLLKVFASWVDRRSDLENNTMELEKRTKQASKDGAAWEAGGKADRKIAQALRQAVDEILEAAPDLDRQMIVFNKTMLTWKIPAELESDADVKRNFGKDRLDIIGDIEGFMKTLDGCGKTAEKLAKAL